jgi:hypothetical protein
VPPPFVPFLPSFSINPRLLLPSFSLSRIPLFISPYSLYLPPSSRSCFLLKLASSLRRSFLSFQKLSFPFILSFHFQLRTPASHFLTYYQPRPPFLSPRRLSQPHNLTNIHAQTRRQDVVRMLSAPTPAHRSDGAAELRRTAQFQLANKLPFCSGIFGYVNYLVEKDRKFILDTLVNGELFASARQCVLFLQSFCMSCNACQTQS